MPEDARHDARDGFNVLLLIKHAMPEIREHVPSHDWRLSSAGRIAAARLAREIAGYRPEIVVTSTEPKAAETGRIMAEILGIPVHEAEGLHENDRSGFAYLSDDDYQSTFARFFNSPNERIVGNETAREATERFAAAMYRVLNARPTGAIAIVAHGTVISLFLHQVAGLDPFPLWQRLGLPFFVVLSGPELRLERIVANLSEPDPQ